MLSGTGEQSYNMYLTHLVCDSTMHVLQCKINTEQTLFKNDNAISLMQIMANWHVK